MHSMGWAMGISKFFQGLGGSYGVAMLLLLTPFVQACSSGNPASSAPIAPAQPEQGYLIGPGDTLGVFVWQNPDLSTTVPVRPDGRISLPLLQDVEAAQKTPEQLAGEIKDKLSKYVREPIVTVVVTQFVGPYSQQVRVIGEAAQPKAIPYRTDMSVLDVMIAVGGLTQFAAGNRTVLVRTIDGKKETLTVRLADLMKDGDMTANVPIMPGDVLVIPESWF
jgi:polysaccharide export outer membrane protein